MYLENFYLQYPQPLLIGPLTLHAAVILTLKKKEEVRKGPGIIKVNTKILEDSRVATEVGNEISRMMSQAEPLWDPHTKLEFLKMVIRTTVAERVTEIR